MGAGPANVNCVETGNTAADCLSTCAAGEGACPANVNCVETGNTAAECTVDCKAVAVVITVQSGKGAACLGDHACLAGEGACPAANTANCVQDILTWLGIRQSTTKAICQAVSSVDPSCSTFMWMQREMPTKIGRKGSILEHTLYAKLKENRRIPFPPTTMANYPQA